MDITHKVVDGFGKVLQDHTWNLTLETVDSDDARGPHVMGTHRGTTFRVFLNRSEIEELRRWCETTLAQ